jgi:serine/threonine protein kinase
MTQAAAQWDGIMPLSERRRVVLAAPIGGGTRAFVHRAELREGSGRAGYPVAVKMFPRVRPEERANVLRRLGYVLGCASHVDHPAVVTVFDYMMDADVPFAVLELVDGRSVESLLAARHRGFHAPDMGEGLHIAARVSEALAAALTARGTHGPLGLVHGDLSPRAVLLARDGEVKVGDFGLSMALACESSRVSLPEVVGRLRYLAPEVAQGAPPDARADVFSLGILLYELVCGPRFSPAATTESAIGAVQAGVVPVSLVEPQLPGQLRTILRRCVEPDPARRYPDAVAAARDLVRLASLMGVAKPPPSLGYGHVDETSGELATFRTRRPAVAIDADADAEPVDDAMIEYA